MPNSGYDFLEGGGEMGALIRATDWASTPMGSPGQWPQSLQIALRMILDTPFPMYIAWGEEYIQFYNDGYRPILGSTKHPKALGISTRQTFSEIWHIIGSMFEGVMQGNPVGFPDFMLPLDRNGYVEECYFDFSYSPIRYADGNVGGVLVTVIETTEKKGSEKKLKESYEQYEFAINAAGLGTWDLDPETNRFVGNKRLKKWFGLANADEIVLDRALDIIDDNDRQSVVEAIRAALEPGSDGAYNIQYSIINPVTGKERKVFARGKALFADSGQPYRFSGVLQDITKDYDSLQAVKHSEQNFKNLVIHAPVAMMVLRGPGYIVEIANGKMFELVGRPEGELLNRPFFEGLPEAKEQGLEALLHNVYSTGERYEANERTIDLPRNGKIEKIYSNFVYKALRDADGTISGISVVAIDVTEQVNARHIAEAAEERARLAVEAANMGTFDFFLQTKEIITSQRFDEIFGLNNAVPHQDYVAVIHPEDMHIREEAHRKAITSGRLFYVVRLIKPDKSIRWVQAEGTVFYDKDREPFRLLGTMLDITEQKELQQQKDDFIGIASHELKTPLTSLKASFQLLNRIMKTDPASGKLPALMSQADNSLRKLNSLVEDLLDVSKINGGHLRLNKALIRLSQVVDSCCSHIRMTQTHDVIIKGDVELKVMADPERIEQVLTNLVNNAVKYAPHSRDIVIAIERMEAFAKVSVTDQGIGIPEDKIGSLFGRYYRVESNEVNFSGLGLGLYISHEIVKRHNGDMGAVSRVGQGSTFWFTLPLQQ